MKLSDFINRSTATIPPVQGERACAYVRMSHERSAENGYEIVGLYTELHRVLTDAKTDSRKSVILVCGYDRFSCGWTAPTWMTAKSEPALSLKGGQ
jgi:hypothetical protein